MPVEDVAVAAGLTVSSPARTLVDLAPYVHGTRLERLLDHAWSRRLIDATSQLECCDRLGDRGRPGLKFLRGLVLERGADWIAPASGLESRVNSLLKDAAIGAVDRQVNIGGRTRLGRVDFLHASGVGGRTRLGRVDFLHASGVVLEVQSELFHSSHTSMLDDIGRARAMEAAGYSVVEVWENEIWRQPQVWVTRFRRAIEALQCRAA